MGAMQNLTEVFYHLILMATIPFSGMEKLGAMARNWPILECCILIAAPHAAIEWVKIQDRSAALTLEFMSVAPRVGQLPPAKADRRRARHGPRRDRKA